MIREIFQVSANRIKHQNFKEHLSAANILLYFLMATIFEKIFTVR
jgi:hypothetical protein